MTNYSGTCNLKTNKLQIIIATLAINILSLALPIMVLQVYDRILANHSVGTLKVLTIGIIIAVTLEGILRVARADMTAWSSMIYEYSITTKAMHYFINGDMAKITKHGAGEHNSGKSTLLKLIAGLYIPKTGSITVDGIETTEYMAEDLISHIGFMSDEGTIFQDTILNNLTGFNEDKEYQAMEIAKLLKINDDIAMLPYSMVDSKVYDVQHFQEIKL